MDCTAFEDRLEAHLEGRLGAEEASRCQRHAEGCPSCRELLEIGTASCALETPETELGGLVAAVLARTTGRTCDSAHERICTLVDSELGAHDRQIVESHLADCPECSGVATTLTRLSRDLPRLAEMLPDKRFVADVLATTLPFAVRLRRRRRAWRLTWLRWVERPRFAVEGAYVAGLLLLLALSISGTSVAAIPQKAAVLTRSDQLSQLVEPLATLENRVTPKVQAWWSATGVPAAAGGGSRTLQRTGQRIGTEIGTFVESFASFLEMDDPTPEESKK